MARRGQSLPLFDAAALPAPASGEPPQPPRVAPSPIVAGDALWLCVYLFDLPLEVFAQPADPAQAFAVSEGEGSQQRILACNQVAADQGVRRGQSLNSALALEPTLLLKTRQPALELAALKRLMNWSGQFTSQVTGNLRDHVLLEVRGSLRLFGGLATVRERVSEGFASLGYATCVAVAPTPRAALWLARAGQAIDVTATRSLAARLGVLPLAATGWPDGLRHSLRGLGIRQLRDCLRLPRDGFGRRLGRRYLQQLDQALGREPDPRVPWQPPERYRGRLELPLPVSNHAALLQALARLVRELSGFLRARQAGIRRLCVELEHDDGPASRTVLHLLQEERDPEHLLAVLGERLEQQSLLAPVTGLRLTGGTLRRLSRPSDGLFEQRERRGGAPATAAMLVDRLRSRLGSEAVHGLCLVPEHRPESAWRVSEPGRASRIPADRSRPFWLLAEPRRLAIRAGRPWLDGPLTPEAGPERIESGWWDGQDVARDYYRMRTANGVCLWVFRERRGARDWYLHGIFA